MAAIALEIVDGGVMENIIVNDITVIGSSSPIFIRLGNRARGYKEGVPVTQVGKIDGIRISNVQVRNAGPIGCSITGIPGHPVENVWIENVSIHHKGGVTADQLAKIEERIADEKVKSYPESNMWGNLPAKGFFIRHANNINITNVTITTELPDVRPEILRR